MSKVKDVIEALKKFDPELPCVTYNEYEYYFVSPRLTKPNGYKIRVETSDNVIEFDEVVEL